MVKSALPFCLFTFLPLNAQQAWTLTQCIDHAVTHNLTVRQQANQQRQQEVQLSTSRNQRLPDLSASASQNFSFGRGLTAENTYTNRSTSSTSFSLGTSIPLFTGFRIPNAIEMNKLNLQAATADLTKAKNDVSVQVAQAYVQILYNMELSDVARRQIEIDSAQTRRLQALFEVGKASEAQVAQQEATLAQSRLTATQADNNRQIALLTLSQLLELNTPDGFSIVRPDNLQQLIGSQAHGPLPTPDAIFADAMATRPEIEAQRLRLEAAGHNIAIAQADLYPTLSFNAGLGSNYYKTSGMWADNFSTQMKNNFSQYLGFNLNIPLFSRFQTRNSIRSARIEQENQQIALDNTKKTLYNEIQQAYYNTVAAQEKLKSSDAATKSAEKSFRLTTAKYEQGKATITEFNEAKNNYLKTVSDLTQARYEYLYQTALIQFYRGEPLRF
jgi:outer membrane protein